MFATANLRHAPYTRAFPEANPSETSSFIDQSCGSLSSDEQSGCGFPNVIYRRKLCPSNVAASNMRSASLASLVQTLSSSKAELDALVHTLIVDPSMLSRVSLALGGRILTSVLMLLVDDIRGKVLLEVIVSDAGLVWDLATRSVAIRNIYNMADRKWRLRLHQVLIPRFSELCYHPQGNYMASHMLRSYPSHQDPALISAATTFFSDGTESTALCQNRGAVTVAVAWSAVIDQEIAHASVVALLQHPKAGFVFYRMAMSRVAAKVVANLLQHMGRTEHEHLVTVVSNHICGARYAGKIRNALK